MSEVDCNRILEKFKPEGVDEVNRVVGVWEFVIDGCPVDLRIKVTHGVEGMYLAWPNYNVKGIAITPHLQDTAQRALEDTLEKFLRSIRRPGMREEDFEVEKLYE